MIQVRITNTSATIINMEKVTYLDSSGVGVLISIFKSAQAGSFNFFLINMDGSVKNVIELTKLNNYFPIAKNIEEAVLKLINL